MKASTVHTVLYGINLALALVGAGFLAAFLGQLYAEGASITIILASKSNAERGPPTSAVTELEESLTSDPLLVFDLPVAVWSNGVIAFFGLLIFYLVVRYVAPDFLRHSRRGRWTECAGARLSSSNSHSHSQAHITASSFGSHTTKAHSPPSPPTHSPSSDSLLAEWRRPPASLARTSSASTAGRSLCGPMSLHCACMSLVRFSMPADDI